MEPLGLAVSEGSNKNLQRFDLKDSKYMLYNEMMVFLVTMLL